MQTFNDFQRKNKITKKFFSLSIFFILSFIYCDMENRYPDAGEFCTPMREIPECVRIDFRNKILTTNYSQTSNPKRILLKMINRAEYEYEYEKENSKLEVGVLSEHRLRIRTLKLSDASLEKEETYLRIKGPRISLWTRIKNVWNKKD